MNEAEELVETNPSEPILRRVKRWLGVLLFLALIVYAFYYVIFRTTNETGFLGMDKVGRQVFIQSMDYAFDPNADIDSDFNDHNLLSRMFIQEPMRTVFRIDIRDENEFHATPEELDAFLASPASEITDFFTDKATMQDDLEFTKDELQEYMVKNNVNNVADLFSGFGFKKFEVYSRGNLIKSYDLPRTENVLVGG